MLETTQPSDIIRKPVYQQELEAIAGIDRRFLCAPASLLELSRHRGYDINPSEFVKGLDWAYWNTAKTGWNRAGLGRMLREEYGIANVSWWSSSTGTEFAKRDLRQMRRAGYVDSPLETAFLTDVVSTLPADNDGILTLVANGIQVAATVEPGFGENKAAHAIVLQEYDAANGIVRLFDPDSRHQHSNLPELYVREYLSPNGACTVVLPKE